MIPFVLDRLLGPRASSLVAPWLVLLALACATLLLGSIFHEQIKLQDWLAWRYLAVWACAGVFAFSCWSAGHWIVCWLAPDEEPAARLTLSLATGVYAFFLLTSVVGLAGAFDGVSFVLIPVALVALGFRAVRTELRLLAERRRSEPGRWALSPGEVAGFALGALGLAAIWLAVLVPDNASYDTRWYHIAVAEHYAAAGGIVRSVEGNLTVTIPQLYTVLASWAFCMPGAGLFERYELAVHVELVTLLFTLPGIVALVRQLVPGASARVAWLALLAFPSLYTYDTSLHGGADHTAALWAIPTWLSLVRAWRCLALRDCLLFAVSVCGLLMCKYTAISTALPPVVVLTLRGLYLTLRQLGGKPRRVPALLGLLATLGAGLVLTTPHWLKNLIWHGDPVYPILHRRLHGYPWNGDGDYLFAVYQEQQIVAVGTFAQKLKGMFRALYDHSYSLYNLLDFHGTYPIFGSLFTFSLLALPFLRGTRRVWALVLLIHSGIACWYWISNAERYLQTMLPLMASVVAAIALLAWRSGWAARVGISLLIALQVVWGADIPFWPLHRMNGRSGIGLAADFFGQGYGKRGAARTRPFEEFAALGRELPKGSKVLVHHEHLHLGLGTMVVSDSTRMVYGLNYGELGSPAAVHARFKEYGITHVVWEPRAVYGDESVAGDLVYHAYAQSWRVLKTHGSRSVAALSQQAPPALAPSVLVYQCDGSYAAGIYPLAALRLSPYPLRGHVTRFPKPQHAVDALPGLAVQPGYAVINERCPNPPSLKGYKQIAASGSIKYFARKQ